MRQISKRQPPPSKLVEAVASGATEWDDPRITEIKPEIRAALVEDQKGICCYCMRRITPEPHHPESKPSGTKIEHYVAQACDPSLVLEWKNLLAACGGFEGRPQTQQTCDTRKGDSYLNHLDPLRTLPVVKYYADGRIEGPDADVEKELNEILNLNSEILRRNRKAALGMLLKKLKDERKKGHWNKESLRRKREKLLALPHAPEFVGLLEFWLLRMERRRDA